MSDLQNERPTDSGIQSIFSFSTNNYHSDGILKIHARTHITGIELAESNKIFGSSDEICNTCIINLNNDESVVQIRYRQAINGPFGSVVRVKMRLLQL